VPLPGLGGIHPDRPSPWRSLDANRNQRVAGVAAIISRDSTNTRPCCHPPRVPSFTHSLNCSSQSSNNIRPCVAIHHAYVEVAVVDVVWLPFVRPSEQKESSTHPDQFRPRTADQKGGEAPFLQEATRQENRTRRRSSLKPHQLRVSSSPRTCEDGPWTAQ
jgi:hypothetical protein